MKIRHLIKQLTIFVWLFRMQPGRITEIGDVECHLKRMKWGLCAILLNTGKGPIHLCKAIFRKGWPIGGLLESEIRFLMRSGTRLLSARSSNCTGLYVCMRCAYIRGEPRTNRLPNRPSYPVHRTWRASSLYLFVMLICFIYASKNRKLVARSAVRQIQHGLSTEHLRP